MLVKEKQDQEVIYNKMHTYNYAWFITQTVESMLPRFSSEEICLRMIIDASWSYYLNEGKETSFKKSIMLIFYRPNNYTKVLYKDITDDPHAHHTRDYIMMKLLSDHDSCWRTDGMRWISKLFYDSWNFFDKHGIHGRDIEPSFHFSIFGGEPQYRKLEYLKLQDSKDNSELDYKLMLGERIKMNTISRFMVDII